MANDKTPEWKTITDAKAQKDAALTDKLRAARLARDAAAPPPPVVAKKRPAAKRATARNS
ncbi:MAG TPA: hypothetical protein VGB82_06970 [Alphaproteobacteria bacterium]